jgi:hypothetical protein
MGHLVARDGQEALQNQMMRIQGDTSLETWDPLMAAHWAIANRLLDNVARSQGPKAALSALADLAWCPCCTIQTSYETWPVATRPPNAHDAQYWIDDCMDAMKKYAVEKGLVS